MSRIISVVNQKGGVSKTTTAAALIHGLAARQYRVLAVDTDSQCSLSYVCDADESKKTLYDVIIEHLNISDAIQNMSNYDIINGSQRLDRAMQLTTLNRILKPIKNMYDYIVIDTPPSLSMTMMSAIYCSDSVIIPTNADYLSIKGIEQLLETISAVDSEKGIQTKIDGILLTKFDTRSVISRDCATMIRQLAEQNNIRVFDTTIRNGVAIKESQILQQSMFEYAPKRKPTTDYAAFIDELLRG